MYMLIIVLVKHMELDPASFSIGEKGRKGGSFEHSNVGDLGIFMDQSHVKQRSLGQSEFNLVRNQQPEAEVRKGTG